MLALEGSLEGKLDGWCYKGLFLLLLRLRMNNCSSLETIETFSNSSSWIPVFATLKVLTSVGRAAFFQSLSCHVVGFMPPGFVEILPLSLNITNLCSEHLSLT